MTYRSLERANAHFYDPVRRLAAARRHGGIFYLSSGVNHLRAPAPLLELMGREVQERMLIENYTAPGGALAVNAAIAFEMQERLGRAVGLANICMTVGATGALAGAFHYLAEVEDVRTALVLGLNYSFFSTICDEYAIAYRTVCSEEPGRILPTCEEAVRLIETQRPGVVVLSQPTNPSGELYGEAELLRLAETAEANGCWLVFDEVPSLALPAEADFPVPLQGDGTRFPKRLIWIGSFSKSRSLAGLRAGYALADEPVVAFLRRQNERLLWSPVNAGSSALALDMILRAFARRVRRGTTRDEAIAVTVRRAGRSLRLLSPYSDDFARLGGLWSFLEEAVDWPAAFDSYCRDLDRVGAVCRANWSHFQTSMGGRISQAIPLQAGFNHCVKLESGLPEWAFVAAAFEEAGVDLYTETVFADHDDAGSTDFWVRISTAVEPETFRRGIDTLAAFLGRRSGGG